MKWYSTIFLFFFMMGCTSKSSLTVRLNPQDAQLKSFKMNNIEIAPEEKGIYSRSFEVEEGQKQNIVFSAESIDGLSKEDTVVLNHKEQKKRTLTIPARVEVTVNPPDINIEEVQINGKRVAVKNQQSSLQIDTEKEIQVPVVAQSSDGVIGRRTLTISPGKVIQTELNLGIQALFAIDKDQYLFEKEIRFDASSSTPSGSIEKYIWDFGDGSDAHESNSSVTHIYQYNPTYGATKEFEVALTILVGGKKSPPIKRTLSVGIGRKDLEIAADIYPDPNNNAIHPGDELLFKIKPVATFNPKSLQAISVDFGDGHSTTIDSKKEKIKVQCEKTNCSPIYLRHTYNKKGTFPIKLSYQYDHLGLAKQNYQAKVMPSSLNVKVVPRYSKKEELIEKAWTNLFEQITRQFQKIGLDRKKLALSSLDNANFEYNNPQDVIIISKMTQLLVAGGYTVLEKNPSALIRLAHESVVNIKKDGQLGDYREYLEYGLSTRNLGPTEPFRYNAQIEGVNDRSTSEQDLSQGTEKTVKSEGQTGPATKELESGEKNETRTNIFQSRPLLFSKFNTAENLIVIQRIQDPKVQKTEPIYYNEQYEARMVKRTATVKLNIRVLERSGTILWIGDLEGTSSELAIPQFIEG